MTGIDPDFRRYLRRTFSQIMRSTAVELIEKYGRGNKKTKATAMKEVEKLVTDRIDAHFNTITDYARTRFANPIVDMTEMLPKEDLAHLAESLVNLTAFKRRVSLDTESVGGPIDVAVFERRRIRLDQA